MACPETTVLFQATLMVEPGCLARADILVRDGDGWRLLEVKSACSIDDDHVVDAAFQLAIFEAAGLQVSQVAILHLDRTYRRLGACDVKRLFIETDVTAKARSKLSGLQLEMAAAAETLADANQPAACTCDRKTKGNWCGAFAHFHPNVPAHGSIYELNNLREKKLNVAIDAGTVLLKDWPASVELSSRQQLQLDVHRSGVPHVDQGAIAKLLSSLIFPLYFFDYETCSVPVPMFDHCWPYQQMPFQYSLHVVHGDGTIVHREYLATDVRDSPFFLLTEELMRQIGPIGSVVSWRASFEKSRNRELAEASPATAWFFLDLNERMVDLEKVVTDGHYVHPGFNGRSSIKVVLPIVAPDLSYATLAIGDGGTASDRWRACQTGEIDGQERAEVYDALREYCKLDTWAIVRIWQYLEQLCRTTLAAD
jgi:hypothetical protein